jgi:integrase
MTVAEYADTWLAEKGPAIRPRTLHGYRRAFERELLPTFGRTPLAALTRADIKLYAARRATGGAAANTIRNALAPLRAMLSTALEDGYVRENVAYRLPRVGAAPRTITPPTRAQVDAVLRVAGTGAYGPIAFAAASGLRRGEVFALRWRHVDFERRLINVCGSNHNGEITLPKTAAGERLVPMFGSLRGLLLQLKAASPYKAPDDFVFPAVTGEARNPAGWMRWEFYPTLKRAQVQPFRFHDLRHFAVSQLIAQGANILQISRIAGHADPSITLKVYSHLLADGLTEAADRYDPLHPSGSGDRRDAWPHRGV